MRQFPHLQSEVVTGPHERDTERCQACRRAPKSVSVAIPLPLCWAPSFSKGWRWGGLHKEPGEILAIIDNGMGHPLVLVDKRDPKLEDLKARRNMKDGQA